MQNMKISVILIAAIILISTGSAHAQEASPSQFLTDSSHSIQFGIDYLVLRRFNDKSVSFKTHLSRNEALRFGITMGASSDREESTVKKYSGDTLVYQHNGSRTYSPSIDLMINADYLFYAPAANDLYLFAGGGPQIGFSQDSYSERFYRSWSAGAAAVLGAEWFASRNISLHGEYTASLYYSASRTTDWDIRSTTDRTYYETTGSNIIFHSGNVIFGLSVYF